jgi:hypothetical protein
MTDVGTYDLVPLPVRNRLLVGSFVLLSKNINTHSTSSLGVCLPKMLSPGFLNPRAD